MRREDVRLALVFKDFAAFIRTSCVGLNVAGFTTAKVLNKNGIETVVFPVRHNIDIVHAIDCYNETHKRGLTHVVISAPWLSVFDLRRLIENFKDIQFVILSHSNVGFLQADPWGVFLLRQYHKLAEKHDNLKVGGNSERFVDWMLKAYSKDTVFLPNLYPVDDEPIEKPVWDGVSTIKIGAFGAIRPEKNFMTAAAAAVAIQNGLGANVELHMSAGGEGERGYTSSAIDQMCEDTGITVIRHAWDFWDRFIQLVASMDLMLQVSYTESFNLITADGISVGVPSVVSPAITWCPTSWKADPDDAIEVAEIGIKLLTDAKERGKGIKALRKHNARSLHHWIEYLTDANICEKIVDFVDDI